jgi:hypothetical protein
MIIKTVTFTENIDTTTSPTKFDQIHEVLGNNMIMVNNTHRDTNKYKSRKK